MDRRVSSFKWLGSRQMCLDTPTVDACGAVLVGRYGGCTSAGADKNEDAALVWVAADGSWEFAVLLDAHFSAQSADLVLAGIEGEREAILSALSQPVGRAFELLEGRIVGLFRSAEFRARAARLRGETSCLLCARKGHFLWWMSVGDCVVYLMHPELAKLGQFALNQRQFYEWIGRVNSFDLSVPCYSSGVRELRPARSLVLMATDGLLECGQRPYEDPEELYADFRRALSEPSKLGLVVKDALLRVDQEEGRDSATVIAWMCSNLGGS